MEPKASFSLLCWILGNICLLEIYINLCFILQISYVSPVRKLMASLMIKFFIYLFFSDFEIYLLAFDNKECFLIIDFVLYVNIAGNRSYFIQNWERFFHRLENLACRKGGGQCWFSQTSELIMLCNILANFVMLSNWLQCIVFHLICLGLITSLSFLFLSLEGYGSRSC